MPRMTMRVGALESTDLPGPYRYLEHILSTSRKFLEALEVSKFPKNGQNPSQNLEISSRFFQKKIKKFLRFLGSRALCACNDHGSWCVRKL